MGEALFPVSTSAPCTFQSCGTGVDCGVSALYQVVVGQRGGGELCVVGVCLEWFAGVFDFGSSGSAKGGLSKWKRI